ncbi:MAG TPA: ABC transporter permease [Galbitalea sp.]|nr:ABC transporter permease [Galbitalea sp.]
MSSQLSALGLVRRGIASSPGGLAIIAVIAALVSLTAVAGPRATGNVLQQDLNYRLSTAGPTIRDLQSSVPFFNYENEGDPAAVEKTVKAAPAALGRVHGEMPAALRSIAGPGRYVESYQGLAGRGIQASGPPKQIRGAGYSYSVEANPELRTDAVLVAGKWPAAVPTSGSQEPIPLVMTVSAAKTVGWKVGQVQQLSEQGSQTTQPVILVGTIRPRDPTADYWQLDGSRERASVETSPDGDGPQYFGTVWMDAASWPSVSYELAGGTLRVWYPINSAGLTESQIGSLSSGLHRFVAKPRTVGASDAGIVLRFSTNLGEVIDDYLSRAGAGNAVLSIVESGPIGTGAALLLLAILSLVERRRRTIELLRARGAAQMQFQLETGAVIAAATLPGAALGAILAVLITGGAVGLAPVLVALAVAVLPPVFAGVAAGTPPVVLARGGVARPNRWRWVIDAILVLLAALAIVVLVQRGLGGSTIGLGTDPLLAVTPLLIAAAACALVLRVVPIALRRLRTLIHRGRGVIGLVGRANSARAGARFLPVFAVLTGLSVSIFAASILDTEQTGIRDAAVNLAGADISITGTPLSTTTVDRLRRLQGVADLAAITSAGGANLVGDSQNVAVYTVNPRDLAAVESVLPTNRQLFQELGTTRDGRTVAIGGGLGTLPRSVGRFEASKSPAIAIDDISVSPPKFIGGYPWLLLATSAVPKDIGLVHEVTSVLIRVAPGTNQVVLQRQIVGITGTAETVRVADSQVQSLSAAPLVGGLESLSAVAIILSLVLCVLALMLALIMSNRERGQVLGRLRALGFSRRQATALVAWEIGPMTALGIVAGILVGIALPVLFLSVVDLSTFIGADQPPALILDAVFIGIAVLAFAASAVAAVLATSVLSARSRLSGILREPGV